MTGYEVAKAVKQHKGAVCVAAVMRHDAPYIRVVKSDLVAQLELVGNDDAGCEFRVTDGVGYVDAC